MKKVYFGQFSGYDDMLEQWGNPSNPPLEEDVLFAVYGTPAYEGYAIAVFKKDGKLYEVNDSHCSCHGLENWIPEETTKAALGMRSLEGYYEYPEDAIARFKELFPPKKTKPEAE
jgi:hypothetical protein